VSYEKVTAIVNSRKGDHVTDLPRVHTQQLPAGG
jgi:hypothetical protein